jgi:hypothetical protein
LEMAVRAVKPGVCLSVVAIFRVSLMLVSEVFDDRLLVHNDVVDWPTCLGNSSVIVRA